MGNEKYFDENVKAYDRFRTTYGTNIFEDIIKYANITQNSQIIEIGCGTGNATRPFLNLGAKVTAIEVGENLAQYTKNKYKYFSNFYVENIKFEDFYMTEEVDLIFSATAFHWIPSDIGHTKCLNMLKNNGVLALFWNTPEISNNNPELKRNIDNIYSEYLPDKGSQTYEERCNGIQWLLNYYGYKDLVMKLYKEYRTFDPDSYIGLLQTYSNHMALPKEKREPFFSKIHHEIAKFSYIEIEDTIDLHLGRKVR